MREVLVGLVILVTLVGVAVGRYPRLRMNRATIALVGATVLLLLGVLDLDTAFAVIDWHTLALLLGMMILNANLKIAGFFGWVTGAVVRIARTPASLLALLIAASGILSAVFLNDTIAIVLTPLVVDVTRALGRKPVPYLIGLVTAANLGSVATLTGNPQNMIIGLSSGMGYVDFAGSMLPVALGGMVIAWCCLVLLYRNEFVGQRLERPEFPVPAVVRPRLLAKCALASVFLVVCLVAGMPIALAALGAGSIVLVTRRLKPARVFQEIDWGLMVFFAALFVVTGAVERSAMGAGLLDAMAPLAGAGVVGLTCLSAVVSNLVSNVPAVLLLRPVITGMADPHQGWLVLAMATTFAGNLTLLGSVANLIVAEAAARKGVRLGFLEYLRAGVPITLLSLLWGILLLG